MDDEDDLKYLALSGLLLILAVVVGFLTLVAVMKFNGYPEEIFIRWNPTAKWLREYGMWFLLIPVVWLVWAIVAGIINRGVCTLKACTGFGFIVGPLILLAFFVAAANSYSRPIFAAAQGAHKSAQPPEHRTE